MKFPAVKNFTTFPRLTLFSTLFLQISRVSECQNWKISAERVYIDCIIPRIEIIWNYHSGCVAGLRNNGFNYAGRNPINVLIISSLSAIAACDNALFDKRETLVFPFDWRFEFPLPRFLDVSNLCCCATESANADCAREPVTRGPVDCAVTE